MIILVELFGKKFKVKMKAKNFEDAKYQITGKIKFTDVSPKPMSDYEINDFFDGIFTK